MNEIVNIINVCKTYSMGTQKKAIGKNDSSAQVQALKGVSAVIEKGEFTAIAGPLTMPSAIRKKGTFEWYFLWDKVLFF